MGAKLLGEFAEFRGVHPDRERAARCDRGSAWSGAKAIKQGALGIVHPWLVEDGETWRRALGGHVLGILSAVGAGQRWTDVLILHGPGPRKGPHGAGRGEVKYLASAGRRHQAFKVLQ